MSTLKDVAALAKVSHITVSHVLNGTRPVSASLKARVMAAVAELNYRPSEVARALRRSETRVIGMLVPDVKHPFFAELVVGAEDACREAGYSMFLCNDGGDRAAQRRYLRTLMEKRVDGLIVSSVDDPGLLVELVGEVVPFVTVNWKMGTGRDRISLENESGAFEAVRHLLALGHRRIACLAGPLHFSCNVERMAGWRRALQAAGVEIPDAWLTVSDFTVPGGHMAARELLTRHPEITALFACNDLMAVGALRAAADLGIAVPDDLSVMGFDRTELGAYVRPSLSSVGCAIPAMGRAASEALIQRIRSPELPFVNVAVAPEVVVRESTGVAPGTGRSVVPGG